MPGNLICYHGGPPGLRVGQSILPPAQTGVASTSEYGGAAVHDKSKVYVTPDKRAALMFASLHPSGDGQVYRVETRGDVIHDPDCSEIGLSYTCDRAVVLGRVRVKRKTMKKVRAIMVADHA